MAELIRTRARIADSLQGIQHVGLTVDDMNKSITFYVEILGGVLALQGDAFSGEALYQTLFQKECLEAAERRTEPRALGVVDVRDGSRDVLDVRFVSFGNTVLEMIHFRGAKLTPAAPNALGKVASCVGNANALHLCFAVKEDVDLNQFALDLEKECAQYGIDIACNRIVRVNSEAERKQTDPQYAANKFWLDPRYPLPAGSAADFGEFEGFGFFYCKGPNGEQLEFNQATRKAKQHLLTAQLSYDRKQGTNFA